MTAIPWLYMIPLEVQRNVGESCRISVYVESPNALAILFPAILRGLSKLVLKELGEV
jgi:hypothetical protein